MITVILRLLRSPRHRHGAVAVVATVAMVVVLAHSLAAEGEPGHHGAMEMGGDAAICLAVFGGMVGAALGMAASRICPPARPPRVIRAVGRWTMPAARPEPRARAGPTELQVFRL